MTSAKQKKTSKIAQPKDLTCYEEIVVKSGLWFLMPVRFYSSYVVLGMFVNEEEFKSVIAEPKNNNQDSEMRECLGDVQR